MLHKHLHIDWSVRDIIHSSANIVNIHEFLTVTNYRLWPTCSSIVQTIPIIFFLLIAVPGCMYRPQIAKQIMVWNFRVAYVKQFLHILS